MKSAMKLLNKIHSNPNLIEKNHRKSQQELSEQLDSLIAQLRSIEDIQQASPQFGAHVQKLLNIKNRITVIFSVLQGAQVCIFRFFSCIFVISHVTLQ